MHYHILLRKTKEVFWAEREVLKPHYPNKSAHYTHLLIILILSNSIKTEIRTMRKIYILAKEIIHEKGMERLNLLY